MCLFLSCITTVNSQAYSPGPPFMKFRDPVMAAGAPQVIPTKGNKCMISIQDTMRGSEKQLIKAKLATLGFWPKLGSILRMLLPEYVIAFQQHGNWHIGWELIFVFFPATFLWERHRCHSLSIVFLPSSLSIQFTLNWDFQKSN